MNTLNRSTIHPLNRRLAALCLALVCAGATTARAATIAVTSTADSGGGSLRDALASAADGDTIDASGVSGTILLTSGELVVSKGVTILGPGPGNLAVDGNAATRLFYITYGNTVTIAGLTMTNGHVPYQAIGGGAIFNDYATLTVSNCTLSSCSASGTDGGGIYNFGCCSGIASLQIVNSTLSGNPAVFGSRRRHRQRRGLLR